MKPASVISTSYSYNEADLTPFYTAGQCAEYAKVCLPHYIRAMELICMQLGLMGVTVLYASGDFGVSGVGDVCLTSSGNQSITGQIFNPTFPGIYKSHCVVSLRLK